MASHTETCRLRNLLCKQHPQIRYILLTTYSQKTYEKHKERQSIEAPAENRECFLQNRTSCYTFISLLPILISRPQTQSDLTRGIFTRDLSTKIPCALTVSFRLAYMSSLPPPLCDVGFRHLQYVILFPHRYTSRAYSRIKQLVQ